MTLTQIKRAGLDGDALDRVFTIGASGNSAYTFQGEGLNGTVNNPTLYLTRGKTYRFENGSGGHPIRIQSTSGASGTQYNTGVTNNAQAGTVIMEVQHNAPDTLYYQCTSHPAMNGILYVTGALSDGSVTDAKLANNAVTNAKVATNAISTATIINAAVTNDKIADSAISGSKIADGTITNSDINGSAAIAGSKLADGGITEAKIADDAVTTQKIAANAITTNRIADQAVTLDKLPHGTSSNNGKFLRANNGADPTFESLPASVTINNDGSHRIMTSGGGTTLDAEGNLTFDGDTLTHGTGGLTNAQS
ncbi:MAG: hypothetical protein CM15mV84_150 [uncultured marine virus]|nr:MAG: hypothetical protein CM15mV84_150 [uncultured marine virus]